MIVSQCRICKGRKYTVFEQNADGTTNIIVLFNLCICHPEEFQRINLTDFGKDKIARILEENYNVLGERLVNVLEHYLEVA